MIGDEGAQVTFEERLKSTFFTQLNLRDMPSLSRHLLLCSTLLLLLTSGCGSGWAAAARCDSRLANARQQVRVWVDNRSIQLHAIRLTSDSISGIPYLQPITCDSCRVSIPATAVDSIQTGDPTGGLWATTTGLLVALMVYVWFSGGFDAGGT